MAILLALALVVSLGIVALPMAGTAEASATDVWVATTGDDTNPGTQAEPFATIQKGIDTVAELGIVHVAAGTYNENVDVTKTLSLVASGTANVTALAANNHVFNVTSDNVTISGFTVEGATDGEKAGIYLDQVESCNISANTCLDNDYGICLDNSDSNTLTSNTASSNTECGIYLDNSDNNTLTSNTANLNTKHGIYLDGDVGSYSNTVDGNTANRNDECGIYVDKSSNNTLTSNTANSNTEYGIYLDNSDSNTLSENTVSGNDGCGINLDGSNNNTLTGNGITGNNIGVEIQESVDASTISINFNNIHGNIDYGVENSDSETADATNNWWGDASGPYNATTNPAGTGDAVSDNVDYEPWTGAGVEEAKTEDVSGTGGTIPADESPTGGDVTVSGSGIPADTTVTTAKYDDNPGGTPTFSATGNYYDVHLNDDTGVNSLTINFCPATPGTTIYYWDEANSAWYPCSNQIYQSGCIVVTITGATNPSLGDLTGLPFGGRAPPPPVGGEAYPANKLAILAPWIALAAAIIAGTTMFIRRRKAQS